MAVKWHLADEDLTEQALDLLRHFVAGACGLLAPEHIRYEVPSAITVATRRAEPRLTVEQGRSAIAEFLGLPLATLTDDALLADAYTVAHQYGCAYYDAVYLTLSQRTNRPFVTADRRFYRRISGLPLVIWLADWSANGSR